MKTLQMLVELVVDMFLFCLPKGKPSDLVYHIVWFNEQGWAARFYANGQLDRYIYHPYTKL